MRFRTAESYLMSTDTLFRLLVLIICFCSCRKEIESRPSVTANQEIAIGEDEPSVAPIGEEELEQFGDREIPYDAFWVSDVFEPNIELAIWNKNLGDCTRKIDYKIGTKLELRNGTFDATVYHPSEGLRDAIQTAKELRWLKYRLDSSFSDLEWITQLSQLRGLVLQWNGSLVRNQVAKLARLQKLELLELRQDFEGELPNLPKLQILKARLSDYQVPSKGQFPELIGLYLLLGSEVTDVGIKKLTHANPNLKFLTVFNLKNVTHHSSRHVARLQKLVYLHIGSTPLADRENYYFLLKKLPNCYIGVGD